MTDTDIGPRFEPATLTVPAGKVVFFLENVPGPQAPDHNMRIGSACVTFDPDGGVASGEVFAKSPPDIAPGETGSFTIDNLPPGTYVFWCSVAGGNSNHAANGMVGTLTVTPR